MSGSAPEEDRQAHKRAERERERGNIISPSEDKSTLPGQLAGKPSAHAHQSPPCASRQSWRERPCCRPTKPTPSTAKDADARRRAAGGGHHPAVWSLPDMMGFFCIRSDQARVLICSGDCKGTNARRGLPLGQPRSTRAAPGLPIDPQTSEARVDGGFATARPHLAASTSRVNVVAATPSEDCRRHRGACREHGEGAVRHGRNATGTYVRTQDRDGALRHVWRDDRLNDQMPGGRGRDHRCATHQKRCRRRSGGAGRTAREAGVIIGAPRTGVRWRSPGERRRRTGELYHRTARQEDRSCRNCGEHIGNMALAGSCQRERSRPDETKRRSRHGSQRTSWWCCAADRHAQPRTEHGYAVPVGRNASRQLRAHAARATREAQCEASWQAKHYPLRASARTCWGRRRGSGPPTICAAMGQVEFILRRARGARAPQGKPAAGGENRPAS